MKQFIVFSHFVKDHIGVKLNSLKKTCDTCRLVIIFCIKFGFLPPFHIIHLHV